LPGLSRLPGGLGILLLCRFIFATGRLVLTLFRGFGLSLARGLILLRRLACLWTSFLWWGLGLVALILRVTQSGGSEE